MSHALVALAIPASSPVIPAKAGIQKAADIVGTRGGGRLRRLCHNQDLQDWRDLQDFAFVRLALFATTVNPAKTNRDERLPPKDEPDKS